MWQGTFPRKVFGKWLDCVGLHKTVWLTRNWDTNRCSRKHKVLILLIFIAEWEANNFKDEKPILNK